MIVIIFYVFSSLLCTAGNFGKYCSAKKILPMKSLQGIYDAAFLYPQSVIT